MKLAPAGFLIIFGLFWSTLVLLFDGFTIVPAVRQVISLKYATTEGTMISSEITHSRGSKGGTTYGVQVKYSYTVNSQTFTGERYRYDDMKSSDSAWAHKAVAEYAPKKKVKIFYNPSDPADALLVPGIEGSNLFIIMFLTPFNAIMLGIWWAAWATIMSRFRKSVAGGFKIIQDLKQTRINLTEYSPLIIWIATLAASAFLSIFIVAFLGGGFHPSMKTAMTAWIVILGISTTVAMRFWLKIRSGHYALILDNLHGTIDIPALCGRRERLQIPCSKIKSFYVSTIEGARRKNGTTSYQYAPTVDTHDSEVIKLAPLSSEEKANEFTSWLKEQMHGAS